MHFRYKFDPSRFNYSAGWKAVETPIESNKAIDEILEQYHTRHDVPLVAKNHVRKLAGDMKKSMEESGKTYTEYYFNINSSKIRKTDREKFLEILGILFDRVSIPHSDGRKTIPLALEDEQEFEYIVSNLDRSDRLIRPERSGRYELSISNPAFTYYFYNILPPLSRDSRRALLSGVLTNNLVRLSNNTKSHEKIVFRTSNEISFDRIDLYTDLEKLHAIPLHYQETVGNNNSSKYTTGPTRAVPHNSVWYLKPSEIDAYVIEDFIKAKDKLKTLPDFSENPEKILTELITFKRIKTAHAAFLLGEMGVKEHDERVREFHYNKRLLNEWQATLDRLKKKQASLSYYDNKDKIDAGLIDAKNHVNELQPIVDELQESLYDLKDKKPRKKSNRWRKKQEWNNQRASEKYGK